MSFLIKNKSLLGICLLFCLPACHDKAALKQVLIEKTIQEKIVNHIRKKKATCRREYMKDALALADSLMIKLALSKVDTNSRINRPTKPLKPAINLPTDTTPIKPLFKDSIQRKIDSSILIEDTLLLKNDTSSSIE